jgi:conjugal transfer/entry exclusion protein
MTDPGTVLDRIAADANDLDRLSKAIYDAMALLDEAEERWDSVLDQVTQTLEEEYAEAGRKSVPEHTALSAARRENRQAYQNFRRAKRAVERLQQQLSAKRSAASARQSELNALRDEYRALSVAGRPN